MFGTGYAAKAAAWHALGAELAAAGSGLTGTEAVEALPEILASLRQGELACVRLIERADRSGEYACDGAASVAAYVRRASNENTGWATKRVQVGRALADSLQATASAWEAGELGLDHASVIDQATKKLVDDELVESLDAYLALLAATMTPKELSAASEDLRSQAAPEETAAENAKKRAAQTFHLSQTTDGMWRADGWLDAEAGLIVSTAIAAFLRKALPDGDLLSESVGRRRADALVDICRQAITHADKCQGKTMTKHTLVVGVMHQQLLDRLGTAGVAGAGNLPAAAARRMACDANVIPVVYGADSQALDYGRTTRSVSDGLSRAINARDGGCTFPGCDRPPAMCEAHHRKHWVHGGKTKDTDLESLCVFHHHLVHEGGWTISLGDDADRTPWFHPPDDRPGLQGKRRTLIHPQRLPQAQLARPTDLHPDCCPVAPARAWRRSAET